MSPGRYVTPPHQTLANPLTHNYTHLYTHSHPDHTDHTIFQPPPPSPATTDDPNSWVVELSTNAGVLNTTTIQDPGTRHYLFTGLVKGTTYRARVAGVNDRGMGAFSDIVYTNTTVDRE